MAVAWRVFLLVLLVQKSIGQEFKQEEIQQAIHRVQNVLKAHKSRRLTLATELPDFEKMCKSSCWTSITKGMVTMYKALEADAVCAKMMGMDTECTKPEDSQGPPPDEANSQGPPPDEANSQGPPPDESASQCMFDQCDATGVMGQMCAGLKDKDPTSDYNKQKEQQQTFMTAEQKAQQKCSDISMGFFCYGICGTACQADPADSVEERKLFCSPHEDTEEHEDDGSSSESAEENCGGGMDGDAMSDMFGFMCSKNDEEEYCQAKFMELAKEEGVFQSQPEELFPDVCAIDCETPTGKAIKDLGCCMAGSMVGMRGAEAKAARAGVYACGGLKAMTFCGESLPIPQVMLVGAQGVAICPTTIVEETLVVKSLASGFGVPTKHVTIIACKATGSACGAGRRLGDAANSIEYTVRVKGSAETIAAKQATIATKMKTVETETGGKVDVPANGLKSQVNNNNTAANKAGQDSLGLSLGMLVFMSAIFK